MSDIPPDLLAEVLREVEAELGHPDKYSVPIDRNSIFTWPDQ
jgi:hypothetical protein